jgi:hypothetical protein
MASSKKATNQKWIRTECASPLPKVQGSEVFSLWFFWKRDNKGKPKKWLLSASLQMSDSAIFKSDVLWTHGIPADSEKPSVISGIFCPATFVMTDFVTRIEFTIDQLSPDRPEVGIVKFSFKLVESQKLVDSKISKTYASVIPFPPEEFSGWKKIEQKALTMVRVVGEALPPLTEGRKQKDWVYRITDYVRGDADDVKPLKAGREHQDSARSKEALNRLVKLLKPDEKKPGGRISKFRLNELATHTNFSEETVRKQVTLIRKRKETK